MLRHVLLPFMRCTPPPFINILSSRILPKLFVARTSIIVIRPPYRPYSHPPPQKIGSEDEIPVVVSPPTTNSKKKSSVRRAGSVTIHKKKSVVSDADNLESLSSSSESLSPLSNNSKIIAYCTAEEYDFQTLSLALKKTPWFSHDLKTNLTADVFHVLSSSQDETVSGGGDELFIFRDGSFVVWGMNASSVGSKFISQILKKQVRIADKMCTIETNAYPTVETEIMEFIEDPNETTGLIGDLVIIGSYPRPALSKLAFSHGLTRSTKLAVLESLLEKYLSSTRTIPQLLALGHPLRMSRTRILQVIGQLLSVRALLNLSSVGSHTDSLLDIPEYYWSQPALEEYYTKVCRWLDVKPRISVLNQKLDYASEFANVLRGHLSEQHSLKLEWFIIILIAIEVVFGVCGWAEKLGYIEFTTATSANRPQINLEASQY